MSGSRFFQRLRHDQRGVIYLDFLMAFVPLLLLFLGIVQLALIRAAELVVRDAALRGARAAIVILDDDPQYYAGAQRGSLAGAAKSNDLLSTPALSELGLDTGLAPTSPPGSSGGPRLQAIRNASYVSLAVLAPPLSGLHKAFAVSDIGLGSEIGSGYPTRFGLGFSLFNRGAAAITVQDASTSSTPTQIAPHASTKVRVSYLYYCGIPIVSELICAPALRFDKALKDTENKRLFRALSVSNARFALLQAEVTLPNQGARYHGDYDER